MSPAGGFARHLPVVGGEEPLQRQPSGQHERAPQQVRRGPLPDAHRDGEQLQPDRVAAERVRVPGAAAARRQGQHAGAAGGNPGIQRERWVALAEVALRAAWTVRVAGGPQSCWYQVVCSAAAETLQSTVVSGALIPASTPTVILLTTPAARPRGSRGQCF